MAAINDITGHSIQTREITKEYEDNHEKIFGKKEKSSVKRWIQDPVTFKLVPADEYYAPAENAGPYIRDDIKPYQSMIDGRMIEGRKMHREHLKSNNCIEAGDMPIKNPERPKDNSLKERLIYEVMHNPANRARWK
jgi:hypothetical protein